MQNTLLIYATPVFLTCIAVEYYFSLKQKKHVYRFADTLSSIGCGVFTVTSEVMLKAAGVALYLVIEQNLALWQLSANSWLTWILAFFLFDFLYYWAHRWSHEVNLLWGGHVPHHQSEEYNLSTALRQGALQDLILWPIFLPMALLGVPAGVFVITLTISKFYQFWIHTRLIGKLPLIEGILNTPSAHRVHHGQNDQYIDRNHGGTLMVWDRIFGTYVKETEEPIYGVRKAYRSWNPVWAHVDWFAALWRDARRTTSFRDRLRIWFMPTGWRPADVEARFPRERVDLAHFSKFNAEAPQRNRTRALLIGLLVLAGNGMFLQYAGAMSWSQQLMGIVLIGSGLWLLGSLLQGSEISACLLNSVLLAAGSIMLLEVRDTLSFIYVLIAMLLTCLVGWFVRDTPDATSA